MDENSLKDYLSQMGELIEQCDRLRLENEDLRKRLEWQPMETCPIDEPVLMNLEGEVVVARRNLAWNNVVQMVFDDDVVYDIDEEIIEFHIDRASGWMPLPEAE